MKINNLLISLNSNTLNLKKIKYQMDLISKYNEIKKDSYYMDLLHPETRRGVRIPSQFPVPSATFQLKTSIKFSSNSKGCFFWQFNPFFLGTQKMIGSYDQVSSDSGPFPMYARFYVCEPVSSLGYISSEELDGEKELNGFLEGLLNPIDIGQLLPSNIYSQYRLVSAAVAVNYIGPMDETQGVLGGSISFEPDNFFFSKYYSTMARSPDEFPPFDPDDLMVREAHAYVKPKYTVFSNLRHMFYNQEYSCSEGIKLLYFPIDNFYEEFCNVCTGSNLKFKRLVDYLEAADIGYFSYPYDSSRYGFQWLLYGHSLPPSKEYFKMDIYCNFECLPCSEFMSYCPLDVNSYFLSLPEKNIIYEKIRNNAIQKYR